MNYQKLLDLTRKWVMFARPQEYATSCPPCHWIWFRVSRNPLLLACEHGELWKRTDFLTVSLTLSTLVDDGEWRSWDPVFDWTSIRSIESHLRMPTRVATARLKTSLLSCGWNRKIAQVIIRMMAIPTIKFRCRRSCIWENDDGKVLVDRGVRPWILAAC